MSRSSSILGINKNLFILHCTVFIWGFTGILGKLISVTAVTLVWYRVVIAFISLLLYFRFTGTNIKISRSSFLKLFFTGAMVGGHWIFFFAAIKASTVPVTLICLSSITLFTAIFEPIFKNYKISKLEIFAGALIITGILIIFKFESQYTKGIILGLLSAALGSLFPIINSKQVQRIPAPIIAFYELMGAIFWISIFIFATQGFNKSMALKSSDVVYLLLLGTVCTSLAYVAGVSVMREISAFKVALITNLEPVYGILMSFIFFGDTNKMTMGFWIGAGIILSTIFLFPLAQKRIVRYKAR